MRIFAFISVLIGHKFYGYIDAAIANDKIHITARTLFVFLEPFVAAGGAGVVIFFLVSGYIISQVLAIEKTTSFLIRRVFRIYPLYIIAVLIQISVQKTWGVISFTILVQQLLLIGDFFGTPYTLEFVEWTLRVEIVFYIFMAMLRACGFWAGRKHLLIFVLLITIVLMSQLPAFPASGVFTGYFLIYVPFLFIGAGFWLYEQESISFSWFLILISTVFVNYFYLISCYQPRALYGNYAALGFLLFTVAWIFRSRFEVTTIILLLSDLTYSVYLFHNWLFDFFKDKATELLLLTQGADVVALGLLFAFCFLLHRIIERPANKLGRIISLKVTEFKLGK